MMIKDRTSRVASLATPVAAVAPVPTVNDNDRGLPPAERSGPAIIDLLQQAADSTRRSEERAKAASLKLTDDVRRLEQQNAALQTRVSELQERATRAEQWLMHIYEQIHAQFIQPAAPPAPAAERQLRQG